MTAHEFINGLSGKITPEALAGVETCFQFDISGEGSVRKTVTVSGGSIDIQEGLVGDPKCVVRADSADLMKVMSGELNPMMAVMTGKIKISNTAEMMKYAKLFGF